MRMIDADALKKAIADAFYNLREIAYITDIIERQPTIEPEVRHGRWIPNGKRSVFGDLEYLCSECIRKIAVNWAVKDPSEYDAFCSGCGARMDADHIADASKKVGGADK